MAALPWLERAASPDAPREQILAALEAEVAGGEPTGLHAGGDPLCIHQDWVIASGPRR
jgi:hypothetical protein